MVKKSQSPPPNDTPPDLPLGVEQLKEFLQSPDSVDNTRLEQALEAAKDCCTAYTGQTLPENIPHSLRQGILLMASAFLTQGWEAGQKIEVWDVPLTVRAFWAKEGESSDFFTR